ncbi:uncharacterized protein LOC130962752 [Arachis stenosperma]|uniref:uncharacterized protein LOC130962752 n=1 Tax=Arachis stenosperma TaxID=217475 RepID=UPI0025AD3B01|nr:uncharacterized protein LOC130962752 [Arachis stenosperma]
MYQRLMNKVFSGLIGKTVEVYIDDILVKTTQAKELITDLEAVFASLRLHKMRLNPPQGLRHGSREVLGFYDNPKRIGSQPGEMRSNFTDDELEMCQRWIVFKWTPACEEAFNHFKNIILAPLVLDKPRNGETLYLYLAVTDEALVTVLVRDEVKIQQPTYFVCKALQGAELRYSKLKKLTYVRLTSSRRLRQYFQGHQTCNQGPSNGRFFGRSNGKPPETPSIRWKLHVDGASNQTFGGAGIILESPTGVVYKQSVKFEFLVTNNQAECEALLGGLFLAREVGTTRVEICSDSQVVTSQINETYQAKDSLLQKYLEKVKKLSEEFDEVTVQHVPRERNTRADLLSKMASTKPGTGNRSLIQGLVKEPIVTLHITRAADLPSWMDPITIFLENGKLSDDKKTAKALRREAAKHTIIQGQLFKKGLNQPLLKCLHPDQTDYVLSEVQEECCGHHIGGKALAQKLVRDGYYWPSMMTNSKEFVKKYRRCQENANFHKVPVVELSLLMASRPFSQWGCRPLRAFSGRGRTGQVPNCRYRLLNEVGRGRAIGQYILRKLPKILVETSNSQIQNPRGRHLGQRDAICRQEVREISRRFRDKAKVIIC